MTFPLAPLTKSQVQQIVREQSGWAVYVGDESTEQSPQIITNGQTQAITNNASLVINSQIPIEAVSPLWNAASSKFEPIVDGDYYTWILRFKAKTSAPNGSYMNIGLDIGGSFGVIFLESHPFLRGANIEQIFNVQMSGYSGSTFILNGGIPVVTSIGGTVSMYEKEFHVVRHHRAR